MADRRKPPRRTMIARRRTTRKPTAYQRRRYSTWQTGIAMALAMIVAFPASSVVFLAIERLGTIESRVLASGTATVHSCEQHLLREPYACAATAVWQETATFGEPPADITIRSTKPLTGEVSVEERDCSRRYATNHLCPVYSADYPVRSHLSTIPPFLTLFGLMFAGWLVARRIATRITGYPPART